MLSTPNYCWEGSFGGECSNTHSHINGSTFGDRDRRPIRRHRTTKANIRPHLYGGPQVWSPHLLRTISVDPGQYIRASNLNFKDSQYQASI